jgi:hypothetical protein
MSSAERNRTMKAAQRLFLSVFCAFGMGAKAPIQHLGSGARARAPLAALSSRTVTAHLR